MADSGAFDTAARLRAVHAYLRPLLKDGRVLEWESGPGAGREQRAAGSFDVVLVPDAAALIEGSGDVTIDDLRLLLAPAGHLVCLARNADHTGGGDRGRGGGVEYFRMMDALAPYFPKVRMFGLTPFCAFGIAEFEETPQGLKVDSSLADESAGMATHYVAIAGPDAFVDLGYALVQIPGGTADLAPVSTQAVAPAGFDDLRRRLADAQGQADGALRVSRAQTEEIEELRARLRRGAEARQELDEEVARLRRSLTDADESVMTLTRRTTEEMTALAQQVTAGLRAGAGAGRGDASAQLARRDQELAARESALAERDERIAGLEADKQDLLWRLQAAQAVGDDLASALTRAGSHARLAASPVDEETLVQLRSRDQMLEQFRRAAAAHVDEITRLRAAFDEQSTLVAELEEAMSDAEARVGAATTEGVRLRALVGQSQEAERSRRSRLAELEGTLLRLQKAAATGEAEREASRAAEQRAAALAARVAELERELADWTSVVHMASADVIMAPR